MQVSLRNILVGLFLAASFLGLTQEDNIRVERNSIAALVAENQLTEIDFQYDKVEDFYILTGQEKEWLMLLLQDFEGFFAAFEEHDKYYESSGLQRVLRKDYNTRFYHYAEQFSFFDSLSVVLTELWLNSQNVIREALQSAANLSEEQRVFVAIYMDYYAFQLNVCDQERLNIAHQAFLLSSFTTELYLDFIIKYESSLARLSDRSMLFGLGLGMHTLLQKPRMINTGFVANFLFDYNWNKFHIGSRMLVHQHKTLAEFESKPEYDENRPLGLFNFDVYAGYNQTFFDARWIFQPYAGYGFGFFRGLSDVDEPNFSTIQVNSGFFGLKTQYVFNRRRFCDERLLFVNQQHYAFFFDVSYRINPFGRATPELLGYGLLFNVGLVINTPGFKRLKAPRK